METESVIQISLINSQEYPIKILSDFGYLNNLKLLPKQSLSCMAQIPAGFKAYTKPLSSEGSLYGIYIGIVDADF